jgi:hypothetical protein
MKCGCLSGSQRKIDFYKSEKCALASISKLFQRNYLTFITTLVLGSIRPSAKLLQCPD